MELKGRKRKLSMKFSTKKKLEEGKQYHNEKTKVKSKKNHQRSGIIKLMDQKDEYSSYMYLY